MSLLCLSCSFYGFSQGSRQCDQEIKHIKKKKIQLRAQTNFISSPLCSTWTESESRSDQKKNDLFVQGTHCFKSPVRLFASPWSSPGQNPGVGSLSLLQGIFPTQGSNPGLPHCRRILYRLSHQGSPRILEWVACPFSSGSSWPRNQARVSCIAGGFFTKLSGQP